MSPLPVRPPFDKLPLRPDDPPYSAWGLWGHDDQVGALNLIDTETVKQSAKEIQLGLRFSLNWDLFSPVTPGFGRHTCELNHRVYQGNPNVLALDDQLNFNTQKGSQIDGLRHFAYQKSGFFYNGKTKEEIVTPGSTTLGIHTWHEHGTIAGRGVLIDYWSYAERKGRTYNACEPVPITYDSLMECLAEQSQLSGQSLELRKGDVLLIRSGFTQQYLQLSKEQEMRLGQGPSPLACGVVQDKRMLQFLWDHQVAVVGGDAPAWELLPPASSADFIYHEVLLAGWGCPIGELLWLEDLAQACSQHKKWSFFLTSTPLNVPGGVASPANMAAIL